MNFKVNHDLIHDGISFSNGDVLSEGVFTSKQKKRLLELETITETHESVNVEISEEVAEVTGQEDGPPDLDKGYQEVDLTDDDVKKEINDGFTHTELVKEMEALEMDFKKNDSKEKLIDLILTEETDEHFLDLLEGR